MATKQIYTHDGVTGTLPALCKTFNKSYHLVYARLKRGLSIEEAFSLPRQSPHGGDLKTYTYKETTDTLPRLCKKYHKNLARTHQRLNRGMSINDAMDMPDLKTKRYVHNGEEGSLSHHCQKKGKSYQTTVEKIRGGMSVNDALSIPRYMRARLTPADFMALLEDREDKSFDDVLDACQMHSVLTKKECDFIRARYCESKTLDAIGKKYSLTRERVRQIITRSTNKVIYAFKIYSYNGVEDILLNLYIEHGGNYNTIFNRLKRGMHINDAMRKANVKKEKYFYEGETGTLTELCKKFDKEYNIVYGRLQRGMTLKEAFEVPVKSYFMYH